MIIWAGAVRPKTAKTLPKKANCDGRTDRQNDGLTDRWTDKAACRKKMLMIYPEQEQEMVSSLLAVTVIFVESRFDLFSSKKKPCRLSNICITSQPNNQPHNQPTNIANYSGSLMHQISSAVTEYQSTRVPEY